MKRSIIMNEYLVPIIERFQTLIVGLIGFIGVIITISKNAKQSRDQEVQRNTHERESIRGALYSELEFIQKMLSDRENDFKPDGSDILIPEKISTKVYDQNLNRIGLLDTSEIKPIIGAYTLIDELSIRLKLLSNQENQTTSEEGYILIEAQKIPDVKTIHKNFAEKIHQTIKSVKII